MRMHTGAVLIGLLAMTVPALADSVAVTSGSNGTTIVNGKPCRVVTGKEGGGSNSTSITAGGGSVSGTTSVSPGGSGSSVAVGSGSSGGNSSSAATSDCVIHRPSKK
jgi:hypothetical protein